jgi:hypothetical protein
MPWKLKQHFKTIILKLKYLHNCFIYMMIGANKDKYLDYFEKAYKKKLSWNIVMWGEQVDRYKGFRRIFEGLLENKKKDYTIVETGTLRTEDNWADGQSSLLFYEFINIFGGKLISIDINKDAIKICEETLKNRIPKTGKAKLVLITGDSLKELDKLDENVDLLYLDSCDLDKNNPNTSMEHHLNELIAAKKVINKSKNLLIATDDNFKECGKGKLVMEWAKKTHQEVLLEAYQTLIRVKGPFRQDQ